MGVSVEYAAKETLANLWRNRVMALAAILTVAVSLSLVGTALLLRQSVNRQIGEWSNNVSLQIFMNPGATKGQLTEVRSLISQTPQIVKPHGCSYLDPQQSFNEAKKVLASVPSAIGALSPSTVPTVFRCQLTNPKDAATVGSLFYANKTPQVSGVYMATWPGQSIKVMEKITGILQIVLFAIAVILLISSAALILNAIRMAIFSRRREVGVMKLVGATNWFIRVPFMLEGLVQGLLGSLVAVLVVLGSNIGVRWLVNHYNVSLLSASVLPAHQLITIELLVVVMGVAIGAAGSFVAVRRFLDV
jgi:cell division transport system permease protein